MLNYEISTGKMTDESDHLYGVGYSGHGTGLNNSNMESVQGVGPIPRGLWHISTWEDFHPHLGPNVVHLIPDNQTETFGRSGFFIHGDNARLDHSASDGCIILDREAREKLRTSGEKLLTVK